MDIVSPSCSPSSSAPVRRRRAPWTPEERARAAYQALHQAGRHVRALFEERLQLAARYLCDRVSLTGLLRPGRLLYINLRDRWIKPDERLMVAQVLCEMLLGRNHERSVGVVAFFDEAHHALSCEALAEQLERLVKVRRRPRLSRYLSDQDLLRVRVPLLAQASVVMMHSSPSGQNLLHLKKAKERWQALRPEQVASLPPGEAYVSASAAHLGRGVEHFLERPRRVRIRPRASSPGAA